jgi:hypothetical protein
VADAGFRNREEGGWDDAQLRNRVEGGCWLLQSPEIERKAYVDDAGFSKREEGGCGMMLSLERYRKVDVGSCRVQKEIGRRMWAVAEFRKR